MTTPRPAALLREAFLPGDPVSLEEAAARVGGNERTASKALTYLAAKGYFVRVRQRLWVRSGSPPNPYRLGARVVSPYAFVYGSALALHGAAGAERSELLVASPHRFDAFEYDGALYRRALPWPESDALQKVSVGPEFVWVTTPERTLVDCVRVPANAGGTAELMRLSGLAALNGRELVRWVDYYGEANLAARLGFVLESAGMSGQEATLLELEQRRPRARVYFEPGARGGRLVKRWNLIVPAHLRGALGEGG
jgi:predicted transcriptional regulator of viral defense system